jgi:hypothetical protein
MEQALAKYENQVVQVGRSMFFDIQMFEHMQRVANVFAKSTMVPDHFKGNIGNIMIALNFAERIDADPFMVMQNMYVVHGKPGIEGKLVIALLNQCGRFEPLEFDQSAEHCQAFTKEVKSGKTLKGPKVTMSMVKKEGWWDKKGSKWKTIPELMFPYRAATYFARTHAPEVLLGMRTKDELEDIIELRAQPSGQYAPDFASASDKVADLNVKLKAKREADKEDPFRTEYINLRASGFRGWVLDNLADISSGNVPAGHIAEIKEKWGKLYGDEPFPGDEPPVETGPDVPPEVMDTQEAPAQNGNGLIVCPKNGSKRYPKACEENCEDVGKCDKYQEWSYENAQN